MNGGLRKQKIECFVSVVAVLDNSKPHLEQFLRSTQKTLSEHFSDYEIVLIDQCSDDGSLEIIQRLLKEIPSVRFLELSFPVHEDVALAAAVENAIGDFVILMAPGVDPVHCIPELVAKCQTGSDVVVGVARQPQTLGYRLVRPWIQSILKYIGYNLPRNATTLRCLSRRAVNAATQTGRFHHQFYVRISNTGYPTETHHYQLESSFKKKKTLYAGLCQGVRTLVFNSTKPLRWMSGLGLIGSFMAAFFALYSILVRILKERIVEGWTTMVFFMSFLFMLQFAILTFFGEYLGRLLDDRSEHRDYNIAYEQNSSVMPEDDRINVSSESENRNDPPQST